MGSESLIAAVPEVDVRTAVMAALELAIDTAYHDGTPRDLAVIATAHEMEGYWDVAFGVAHAKREDVLSAVESARRGRPKRLLRADARGVLHAFGLLARAGVITYSSCAGGRRQRWLARGGHDR